MAASVVQSPQVPGPRRHTRGIGIRNTITSSTKSVIPIQKFSGRIWRQYCRNTIGVLHNAPTFVSQTNIQANKNPIPHKVQRMMVIHRIKLRMTV